MRALDLLRNPDWNMQALISREEHQYGATTYYVHVGPIHGFGLTRDTKYLTETQAYDHACEVLGLSPQVRAQFRAAIVERRTKQWADEPLRKE